MSQDVLFSNFTGADLGKMPSIARGQARVVVALRAKPGDDVKPEDFVAEFGAYIGVRL